MELSNIRNSINAIDQNMTKDSEFDEVKSLGRRKKSSTNLLTKKQIQQLFMKVIQADQHEKIMGNLDDYDVTSDINDVQRNNGET